MKLKVLTLRDCSFCRTLKEKLDEKKISYEEIDADNIANDLLCSKVEAILKSSRYPIILLEEGKKVTYITAFNESTYVDSESKVFYTFHSIHEAVNIVKHLI